MSKRKAQALDPDIAAADVPTLQATVRAFGPLTRIAHPRIRKMIKEIRLWEAKGGATADEYRSALQEIRELNANDARRS